jgi:hypothetical protein
MNSIKDYIRLYRKFKTDAELAEDTGLSKEEVQSLKRQINLELLFNKNRK